MSRSKIFLTPPVANSAELLDIWLSESESVIYQINYLKWFCHCCRPIPVLLVNIPLVTLLTPVIIKATRDCRVDIMIEASLIFCITWLLLTLILTLWDVYILISLVMYFMTMGHMSRIRCIITAYFLQHIFTLWPSDATWRQRSGSTLAQVIACCLTAPSHYLNQCWLIFSEVQWHSY